MDISNLISNGLVLVSFLVIALFFIVLKQHRNLNLAILYSLIWMGISLALSNKLFVYLEFWHYPKESNSIFNIPLNLYFSWLVFWAVIPVYLFKGKFTLILFITLLWLDFLFMPKLEQFGLLILDPNWFLADIALLLFVWLPGYVWAKTSLDSTFLSFRVFMQVLSMCLLLILIIPIILINYRGFNPQFKLSPILFQIVLIIALPAIVAVQNLYQIGKGTPFPYDPTKKLVQSSVYAYCRNPIQWSFTLLFIPISIYYSEPYLLFGCLISVAYTIGISNPQEGVDMTKRFGIEWASYRKNVPAWIFNWRPKSIVQGTIYFKSKCGQCEQIRTWFKNQSTVNLKIKYAHEHQGFLRQITYIDHQGNVNKGINAIASGLEHIHLGWACLAWFMKLPVISYLLQAIVNALGFSPIQENEKCEL